MKQKIYDNIKGREPEIWVELTADPKIKNIYKISNYGRIMNKHGKILRPDKDRDGYLKFTLQSIENKKIKRFSHRLVGLQFIDNPLNKPEINHKRVIRTDDGNICYHDDNYYENLEWCTRSENISHSVNNSLQEHKYGENAGYVKFDPETAQYICFLLEREYSNKQIMKILGFKKSTDKNYNLFRGLVKSIRMRNSWRWISDDYNF